MWWIWCSINLHLPVGNYFFSNNNNNNNRDDELDLYRKIEEPNVLFAKVNFANNHPNLKDLRFLGKQNCLSFIDERFILFLDDKEIQNHIRPYSDRQQTTFSDEFKFTLLVNQRVGKFRSKWVLLFENREIESLYSDEMELKAEIPNRYVNFPTGAINDDDEFSIIPSYIPPAGKAPEFHTPTIPKKVSNNKQKKNKKKNKSFFFLIRYLFGIMIDWVVVQWLRKHLLIL